MEYKRSWLAGGLFLTEADPKVGFRPEAERQRETREQAPPEIPVTLRGSNAPTCSPKARKQSATRRAREQRSPRASTYRFVGGKLVAKIRSLLLIARAAVEDFLRLAG
jgi:hypothetical protein